MWNIQQPFTVSLLPVRCCYDEWNIHQRDNMTLNRLYYTFEIGQVHTYPPCAFPIDNTTYFVLCVLDANQMFKMCNIWMHY